MSGTVQINVLLDKLNTMPSPEFLTGKEIKILQKAQEEGGNNLDIFYRLLEHADLEASKGGALFKALFFLLGKRKKIIFRIKDKDTGQGFDMCFSFPISFVPIITEIAIEKLIHRVCSAYQHAIV